MHIKLINRILHFSRYKVKCAIGKKGVVGKKREGDLSTPKGKFSFNSIYYRSDRIKKVTSKLNVYKIKKNMGWCDDSASKDYNKLIYFPYKYSAEKLYLKKNIYDIIIVINYNTRIIKKKKGSAIFLHISTKKYSPTKGCIAVKKQDMKKLIKFINKKTKIQIL
ncbi:MAG: L,D-transpeptidase [Pelagibacteraceae bacterium]